MLINNNIIVNPVNSFMAEQSSWATPRQLEPVAATYQSTPARNNLQLCDRPYSCHTQSLALFPFLFSAFLAHRITVQSEEKKNKATSLLSVINL